MNRPKHRAAARYKYIVKGAHTFREVEARIEQIEGEKSKGDAFEVFNEAHVATQLQTEYQEFWPWGTVPLPVRKAVYMRKPDKGSDGIGAKHRGTYDSFQSKFRTGRPTLLFDEVSNFGWLSDRCEAKIIIANCDNVVAEIKQRKDTYCILGPDLDELNREDFQAMEAWLEGETFTRSHKVPRDDQLEAINALNKELESSDRASCVVWCGTGKTLLALWLKESRRPAKTLVLVPTLDLLSQIRQGWHKEAQQECEALYVCSDLDNPQKDYWFKRNDCPFLITTDPEAVRRFLDGANGLPQVLFSTYHSSPVVKEAMRDREAFDLAIFDEAHRTAGRVGRNFSMALDDSQIAIKKRVLFYRYPTALSAQGWGTS